MYANALVFALPLLKDEVNPVDQMLIEGLRVFCPNLYDNIRRNPDVYVHGTTTKYFEKHEEAKKVVEDALKTVPIYARDDILDEVLCSLFPALEKIFKNQSYGNGFAASWAKDKRACIESYFPRYFAYCVPSGDIANSEIDKMFEQIRAGSELAVSEFISLSESRQAVARAIERLRSKEDEIPADVAKALVLGLAKFGEKYPRNDGFMGGTYEQAGILISHIVRNTYAGQEDRKKLAIDALRAAEPLGFVEQCHRWMRTGDDDERNLLSKENYKLCGEVCAERYSAAARAIPIYEAAGEDTPSVLYDWEAYGSDNEIQSHLRDQFERDPPAVDTFLSTFLGTVYSSNGSYPGDFKRNSYKLVDRCVGADFIAKNLRSRYGAQLDTPEYRHDFHGEQSQILAERVAHQFMYLHRNPEPEQGSNGS